MTEGSKYLKIIEWSEVDKCFIGSCPELFYGGCHGMNEYDVIHKLCVIIDEMINLYKEDGKTLPSPISGRDFVNELQKAA